MNINLIVGNICTLLAMGANAASSTRKTVKGVLFFQNIAQLIYCISGIVLRGYSASVQNAVSIARNVAAMKNVKSKVIEWSLVVIGVVLGIAFNNRGLMGLLPVVGNLQYTLAIFWFKNNERAVKISFLISVAFFAAFNVVLFNFVGAVADLIVIITTLVVLLKKPAAERE